jgi:hypothetical protein
MNHATKMAIVIFVVLVVLMLAFAAYGYWSGGWELEPPTAPST